MKAIDIFKKISERQIGGVMLHKNMMRAHDFLGIRCMKRLHEYRMFKELSENDGVERYAINHLNMVVIDGHIPAPFIVPEQWQYIDRLSVSNENRRRYMQEMFKTWHDWEKGTKKLYEECYKELCDMGEVAAAKKVGKMVADIDMELKGLERKFILFNEIEWDLKTIMMFDDEWHDYYKEKTKEIGINIC